eukprot:Amastigsp_a16997_11.p1 type:complete len:156 gc:universal Amastigsp_a16997_11:565-98(-)
MTGDTSALRLGFGSRDSASLRQRQHATMRRGTLFFCAVESTPVAVRPAIGSHRPVPRLLQERWAPTAELTLELDRARDSQMVLARGAHNLHADGEPMLVEPHGDLRGRQRQRVEHSHVRKVERVQQRRSVLSRGRGERREDKNAVTAQIRDELVA